MAPRTRAIDFAHLDRQTMGDRALEQEVLRLFLDQARSTTERLAAADRKERLRLAHALKGSARGVGAFPIASCVADLEKAPEDLALLRRLRRLISEADELIASISR